MNSRDDAHSGYLGHLSPEQEKKLRELWSRFLEAFEFQHRDESNRHHAPTISEHDPPQHSPTSASPPADNRNTSGTASHQQVDPGARSVKAVSLATEGDASSSTLAEDLFESWLNMTKQDDPDALLLRFLRARKWNVAQAYSMLHGALVWRCKELRVDEEIVAKGESWCASKAKDGTGDEKKDAVDFLDQLRMGKVYLHGVDKVGRPIGYVNVATHKPGAQSEETLQKLVVHTIETARCLFAPPVESFCVVFDLTGFSLSNWELPPVKFIIKSFEANYPECLGVLLIHNAPWIFGQLWKLIRSWLDPVIAAKVHFTRSTADLEEFIPRENIIAKLGGPEAWRYQYHEPPPDEDGVVAWADAKGKLQDERRATADRLFEATKNWLDGWAAGDGERVALQQKRRAEHKEELRVNYWQLDPYVRSRSQLDRTGVIKPGGTIDHYPERSAFTTPRHIQHPDHPDAIPRQVVDSSSNSSSVIGAPREPVAVR